MKRFLGKQNLLILKLVLQAFNGFARRVFAAQPKRQPEREGEHSHQSVDDRGDDGVGDTQAEQLRVLQVAETVGTQCQPAIFIGLPVHIEESLMHNPAETLGHHLPVHPPDGTIPRNVT